MAIWVCLAALFTVWIVYLLAERSGTRRKVLRSAIETPTRAATRFAQNRRSIPPLARRPDALDERRLAGHRERYCEVDAELEEDSWPDRTPEPVQVYTRFARLSSLGTRPKLPVADSTGPTSDEWVLSADDIALI